MRPDDELCLCFHVTRRKVENFARIHRPRLASQLSACGGAGTGCGWCVPLLKKIHRSLVEPNSDDTLSRLTGEDYARARQTYRDTGDRPCEE